MKRRVVLTSLAAAAAALSLPVVAGGGIAPGTGLQEPDLRLARVLLVAKDGRQRVVSHGH
jgi:hypothetical protein